MAEPEDPNAASAKARLWTRSLYTSVHLSSSGTTSRAHTFSTILPEPLGVSVAVFYEGLAPELYTYALLPCSMYRVAHDKPARRLVDQRGRRSRTLYRKFNKRKCKVLSG